jgi:hypothetical protein
MLDRAPNRSAEQSLPEPGTITLVFLQQKDRKTADDLSHFFMSNAKIEADTHGAHVKMKDQ